MEFTNRQRAFSLDFCEQDAQRSGLSILLLVTGTLWMIGLTLLFAQGAALFIVLPAALGTLLLAVVTVTAWGTRADWQRSGRQLLWFLIGVTVSVWIVGIVSFGWFFMPLLLCEWFALQFWSQPVDARLPIWRGMLNLVIGFAIIPLVILVKMLG